MTALTFLHNVKDKVNTSAQGTDTLCPKLLARDTNWKVQEERQSSIVSSIV
jgi:hypothetical protein